MCASKTRSISVVLVLAGEGPDEPSVLGRQMCVVCVCCPADPINCAVGGEAVLDRGKAVV